MNLSERILRAGETASNANIVELKKESDIFVVNKEIEKIITDSLAANNNIILVCSKDVDKYIASNYIREFVKRKSVELITNTYDDIKYSTAETIIVPEPSISDMVKLFKFIIEGYKNFVFAINLKSFVRVVETIKLLILLECPNLKEKNISHMLGLSSVLILCVDRNEDGLFEIKNADKLYYDGDELINEQLIKKNFKVEPIEETIYNKEYDEEDDLSESEITDEVEQFNILEDNEDEKTDIETEEAPDEVEDSDDKILKKPINKYKLLREKIRKKKELT